MPGTTLTDASPTTTTAAPTIPGPKPPKKKPPLVCHLMSPQYVTGDFDKRKITNGVVPSPGLCDYILFDILQEEDGTYDRAAYEYLGRHGNMSKYMFSINVYEPILPSLRKTLNKTALTDTARDVLEIVPLHGFGILGEMSQLNASAFDYDTLTNNAGILNFVYARFTNVLTDLGVEKSEVANFFAFRLDNLASRSRSYQGLLEGLNTITGGHLHIVMLLTITSEKSSNVQPPSAWDTFCLPSGLNFEPTIEDAVALIAKIRSPVFTFALTISLRWDLFKNVRLTRLASMQLGIVPSVNHYALLYSEECGRHFAKRSPAVAYAGGGSCIFAKIGARDVASFETIGTIEYKMRNAYLRLSEITAGLHDVGWLVYNVTGGLAPSNCNGEMHRLKKMRQIVDTI